MHTNQFTIYISLDQIPLNVTFLHCKYVTELYGIYNLHVIKLLTSAFWG